MNREQGEASGRAPDHTEALEFDRTQTFSRLGWPQPSHDAATTDPYQGAASWVTPSEVPPGGMPPPNAGPPEQAPQPRVRRGPGLATVVLLALVVGVLGGVGGTMAVDRLGWRTDPPAPVITEVAPAPLGDSSRPASVAVIAEAVMPAVVYLSVDSSMGEGVGSGFVVRSDGYIVTNAHVVEGAVEGSGQVIAHFQDDRSLPAEVVGTDIAYDIAVVKVDAANLPTLQFGDSDALSVGESVVAVGAPLGLDSTVTLGIVSALERPVSTGAGEAASFINAIQTDAAINPGNSGGPLVDLEGRVVGVNSAIAQVPESMLTGAVGSIGLGFAIPANQAEHTANQLIETGTSDHPVIGVLVDTSFAGPGAMVMREGEETEGMDIISPGGAAEEAGIEPGDVIISVDDRRIEDSRHLIVVLRSYRVGDEVEITVQQGPDGPERTVTMTLRGSQD